MRDLLIKADWFEQLQNAPENVQQELFYRIIKYGCLEKDVAAVTDDWSVGNAWLTLKGHIDRMKDAQDRNIENGRKNGRKILGDPQEIYNYCQGHPKAKVDEVGIALGLPKTNAAKGPYAYIYDNPGWKNRKNSDWEISSEKSSEKPNKNSDSEENSEKFTTFDF